MPVMLLWMAKTGFGMGNSTMLPSLQVSDGANGIMRMCKAFSRYKKIPPWGRRCVQGCLKIGCSTWMDHIEGLVAPIP